MIEIDMLTVTDKNSKVKVLNKVSMQMLSGQINGLIGPDGSGKSKLLEVLNTTHVQYSGGVRIAGLDLHHHRKEIRRLIGYVPKKFCLYEDLTVRETLDLSCKLHRMNLNGVSDTCRTLLHSLEPFFRRSIGSLTGGMKQKLALCCAILHQPPLLLLDEPTRGIDYPKKLEVWKIIKDLRAQGMTILFSSSDMIEAGYSEHLSILVEGVVLRKGSLEELTSDLVQQTWRIKTNAPFELKEYLARHYPMLSTLYVNGNQVRFYALSNEVQQLSGHLKNYPGDATLIVEQDQPTLADCYVKLIAR